jgi:predicted phosphodiesterase
MKRLVLSDLHLPFNDQAVTNAWFRMLAYGDYDGIDVIGDMIDCYTLSRFDTNPVRRNNFQKELDEGHAILERMREVAPDADIRYSEGNHEDRLRKILWGRSKALAHLRGLTIPQLMGLEELDVKWHSTEDPYKIRDLWFCHGDILRKNAGSSARAKSDMIRGSVLIGHTHRMGWCPQTNWTSIEDAYEVGFMADWKQLDYVRNQFNWQQGWAEVIFEDGYHRVRFYRVLKKGRERAVVGPDGIVDRWRA